jgi:hypothetical protein
MTTRLMSARDRRRDEDSGLKTHGAWKLAMSKSPKGVETERVRVEV